MKKKQTPQGMSCDHHVTVINFSPLVVYLLKSFFKNWLSIWAFINLTSDLKIRKLSISRDSHVIFIFRTLSAFFEGLMPRDNPKNTRFSINFFTSIGLGGLT